MSRRTLGWSAAAVFAAVLVWTAGDARGLGEILAESKEKLKLKYDVAVEDNEGNGALRVTIVLTLADEGRLKPLDEVQLVVPVQTKKDGGPSLEVESIQMVKGEGGKIVGRVKIPREAAERAQIWLNTHTMDGKLDPDTRLHHVIPIARYLKDPNGAAAAAAGEPAGLPGPAPAADPPKAKEDQPAARKDPKAGEEKPAQPARSDRERMVGNWVIVNEDSGRRKGEVWVITEDFIRIDTKDGGLGGFSATFYSHHLDAAKDPRQIDIDVVSYNGPLVGINIKGIYALDGDELRLCLAERGRDRPAAFPEKPGPGEVLILHRAKEAAE